MKKYVLKKIHLLLLVIFIGNTTTLTAQNISLQKSALGICRSASVYTKTAIIQQNIGQQAIVGRKKSAKTDLIQGYLFPNLAYMGQRQNFMEELLIYPTSKNGVFLVKAPQRIEISEYSVFSLSGQHLVKQKTNRETEITVDVQNLTPGMYFLLVQTNRGYLRAKMIRP